jgi:hypothetical protein
MSGVSFAVIRQFVTEVNNRVKQYSDDESENLFRITKMFQAVNTDTYGLPKLNGY